MELVTAMLCGSCLTGAETHTWVPFGTSFVGKNHEREMGVPGAGREGDHCHQRPTGAGG